MLKEMMMMGKIEEESISPVWKRSRFVEAHISKEKSSKFRPSGRRDDVMELKWRKKTLEEFNKMNSFVTAIQMFTMELLSSETYSKLTLLAIAKNID